MPHETEIPRTVTTIALNPIGPTGTLWKASTAQRVRAEEEDDG